MMSFNFPTITCISCKLSVNSKDVIRFRDNFFPQEYYISESMYLIFQNIMMKISHNIDLLCL